MDLRTFVSKTILDVLGAVTDAQKETGGDGGKGRIGRKMGKAGGTTQFEFDIALAETDESSTGGGIGVFLASVGVGAKAEQKDVSGTTSRVKFTVPVEFPIHSLKAGENQEGTER